MTFVFVRNEASDSAAFRAFLEEKGIFRFESVGMIWSPDQLEFEGVSYFSFNGDIHHLTLDQVRSFCNRRYRGYFIGGKIE